MVFFLKQGFERFAANDYMRRRFPQTLESKTSWGSTVPWFVPCLDQKPSHSVAIEQGGKWPLSGRKINAITIIVL
jgi:hypothetical protein